VVVFGVITASSRGDKLRLARNPTVSERDSLSVATFLGFNVLLSCKLSELDAQIADAIRVQFMQNR
jgi:hypothetical protein